MRPLYHPHPDEITVQGILYALSDPVRVEIFLRLVRADCTKSCVALADAAHTPLPKSTLSQHFKILREAGLVHSERRGVELQNSPRCEEIPKRFCTMIRAILDAYQKEHKLATKKPLKRASNRNRQILIAKRS